MEDSVNEALPTTEAVEEALSPAADDPLASLSPEEAEIGKRLLPALAEKANRLAEAKKAKELEKLVKELAESNNKAIQEELDKIRKANTPLEPNEIEKLLSQEYIEFNLKLRTNGAFRDFVIRELPQAAEIKFFNCIKKAVVPALRELTTIEWNNAMTTADKLQKVIDILPGALETLAELCSISLDPFSKEGIDKAWVQSNLNSARIMHIIEAQINAGRFRDFFFAAARSIPGMTT